MAQASTANPRQQLEYALLLIARQHGGDEATAGAADRTLEQWRTGHPDHEAAYLAARAGWDATRADALRGSLPMPERGVARRRKVLSVLGLGGLLLGAGLLARRQWHAPVYELALETARGRQRGLTLPDGSRIDMDANTRARIAFFRDRREVWLDAGEMRLTVAADAQRPFAVMTDIARVRVLGTVFTVESRAHRMRVAVAEGRVGVWSGGLPGGDASAAFDGAPHAVLTAGEAMEAGAQGLEPVTRVPAGSVGAWQQGWLVFDNTPLAQAVARWNDYLVQPLRLDADPALDRLRLTGSFQLRAPGVFVDSLPGSLPVRTERLPDGSVRIAARP